MTDPMTAADLTAHDAEVRAQALAPIREALAGHPRCDIHPDDDLITCGWKHAVASVQAVLDADEVRAAATHCPDGVPQWKQYCEYCRGLQRSSGTTRSWMSELRDCKKNERN